MAEANHFQAASSEIAHIGSQLFTSWFWGRGACAKPKEIYSTKNFQVFALHVACVIQHGAALSSWQTGVNTGVCTCQQAEHMFFARCISFSLIKRSSKCAEQNGIRANAHRSETLLPESFRLHLSHKLLPPFNAAILNHPTHDLGRNPMQCHVPGTVKGLETGHRLTLHNENEKTMMCLFLHSAQH